MFSLMVGQPHLWDFVLLQTYCPDQKYTAPVGISVPVYFFKSRNWDLQHLFSFSNSNVIYVEM